MVLESLVKPLRAEKKPWELFFYGLLISSIAIFLGYWIFKDKADLVMIFLTVFACVPLMFHAIRGEEEKDTKEYGEQRLLKEHSKVIAFFLFLFLGMTVSFVIWYVVLPTSMSSVLFNQQTVTIAQINAPTSISPTTNAVAFSLFNKILFNNIKVLIFCMIFSFFYGTGAIFILAWNASVVAAAIGTMIKLGLAKYGAAIGFSKIAIITHTVSFSFSRYLVHGMPEMIAYMIAGLAGGIISVAVIKHDFRTEKFQKIILDASTLMIISILILVVAALLEAYVTPVLF